MPPSYLQENRFLSLTTPLGANKLLLSGFRGEEGISRLFRFELDLLAPIGTDVPFEALIGQKVSFGVKESETGEDLKARHFNGIVTELSQGGRGLEFTSYRMVIEPELWALSCNFRSRIFQQKTIPEVLKTVFTGLTVSYKLTATYEPREYLVQYQETDLDFAARLMEEEGISYYFTFTADTHTLVVLDNPSANPDIPENANVIFEEVAGGVRDEERVTSWNKQQNWGSGKYTLWDHNFQLPHKHLEDEETVLDSIAVGKVTHKRLVGGNAAFEVYENPGRYAQRFDGINKSGGEQAANLQKIYTDNKRTAKLRAERGDVAMITIHGEGTQRQFTAGHKFTLQRHFDADGKYLLMLVDHEAKEADFQSGTGGGAEEGHYSNTFICIPLAATFRPPRVTRRPLIAGPQSAVVVGPSGEEIFTDKYGRVKVQFHWDREGQQNSDSSCWLRVTTSWAGKNWGSIHIPRIGQEVIVSFMEGDPDRPIITGSVYNADMMPPYQLPDHKTISTVKSRSSKQGSASNFNELRFEDKKDNEQLFLHAERDMDNRVKHDSREIIGNDRHLEIGHDQVESVGNDKSSTVGNNFVLTTGTDKHESIGNNLTVAVGTNEDRAVGSNLTEEIGTNLALSVGVNQDVTVGANHALKAGANITVQAGANVVIEAEAMLTLKGPGGFIVINPAGVTIQGTVVLINSGGAAGPGVAAQKKSPQKPKKPPKPVKADDGSKRGPLG